jgi:DNA-binding NarL/FixJ family response regulator
MSDTIATMAAVQPVNAKIANSGYAVVSMGNCILLRFLKRKARELELPILARKWNKIDETRISRYEKAKDNRVRILTMAIDGMQQKEICDKLSLSSACVSVTIKKLRKEGLL